MLSLSGVSNSYPIKECDHGRCSLRQKESGFTLIIILLILVLLMIVSATFIRTVDVSNLVAGNMGFKSASIQAAEFGIAQAETTLNNTANFETNTANYFATQQPTDINGLPTTVNWTTVPSTQQVNNTVTFTIQYVIERLCIGALPIQNLSTQCSVYQISQNNSKKINSPTYNTGTSLFYRVTVMVTGPYNTLTYVQAILAK